MEKSGRRKGSEKAQGAGCIKGLRVQSGGCGARGLGSRGPGRCMPRLCGPCTLEFGLNPEGSEEPWWCGRESKDVSHLATGQPQPLFG